MSDFQFLNEHVNLKTEINDELRIVYNNAVNAEKYYAVDSKKCISYVREATTEICKIYSACYNINQNCRWLNDYISQKSRLMVCVGSDIYGKLLYIQQNCTSYNCNNVEVLKGVMWYFYCACVDLNRFLHGKSIISNTPHFLYVTPAVNQNQTSVKDELFSSLMRATNALSNMHNGETAVTDNSNELKEVICDLIAAVEQSNEKLANQEKLINNLAGQFKAYNIQSSLQQQDYDRTYSKINEIFEIVKQNSKAASIDDVWSKVNTIDDKIELIGQIQKQKLNTVTNITNGINKTLDKFIDINEQHLHNTGQNYSPILSVLKKFSGVVKTMSENVVATISNYEETGNWTYVRCYDNKIVINDMDNKESPSMLGWLADKINQAADFIRDIDKRF